jgi:mono/diheme cytochrome c family protein
MSLPTHASPGNSRKHDARMAAWSLITIAITSIAACDRAGSATPSADGAAPSSTATPVVHAASDIDAGRYLVVIGGCNDCHTPGYAQTGGAQPAEADWLMGDTVGFAGPWGVSYPANLRLSFETMTEDDFVEMARAGQGRPPMPWPSLKAMSDSDLRAMYRYVKSLGPKGVQAPAPVGPGVAAETPVINFMPVGPA